MSVRWRELPLTRSALIDRGLRVHGVWTMHKGLATPPRVYIDWQDEPNPHERGVAEHMVIARRIIHINPGNDKPWT